MGNFFAGLLIGAALARKYWLRYVSKSQLWSESDPANIPDAPHRYRVLTQGEPTGSATIRTFSVRPRKRPE